MKNAVPYLDYLRPRGLTWIKCTLRVTVAVQCLGAAALKLSAGVTSPVAEFLVHDLNWPEPQAAQLDSVVAYALLVCGLVAAARPMWPVLLAVTVWFSASALLPLARDPGPRSAIELAEQGVRFLSPLGLLVLDFWPPQMKSHLGRTVVAMWILRLGMAATFTGIGLLAVIHAVESGPLVSLLREVVERTAGVRFSDIPARCWLGAVGGLSMALGVNVLVTRSKPVLVGALGFGLASALSHLLDLGLAGYPLTLMRSAEAGVPAVLFLYFTLSLREFPPEVVAEN